MALPSPVVTECAWHPQYFGSRFFETKKPVPPGVTREAFIAEAERLGAISHGLCQRCLPRYQAEVKETLARIKRQ